MRGMDSMDEKMSEVISDLKSYLEYLKGMGIVSLQTSEIKLTAPAFVLHWRKWGKS
jgi:hypothetical protein